MKSITFRNILVTCKLRRNKDEKSSISSKLEDVEGLKEQNETSQTEPLPSYKRLNFYRALVLWSYVEMTVLFLAIANMNQHGFPSNYMNGFYSPETSKNVIFSILIRKFVSSVFLMIGAEMVS